LIQEIVEVTGIPRDVIQEGGYLLLSNYSVEKRISGATGRQTKREEDTAYSLLGMVEVNMPLIYGEGKANAFIRLQKEIENSTERKYEWFKVLVERHGPEEV
jgi:hypothetical protein